MKILKEILEEQIKNIKEPKFYRFNLFMNDDSKKKTVGMAYLMEGHNSYTIRLWTFLEDKFYLVPSKDDATKFTILTREASKSPKYKNKYHWNIVGNGRTDASQSVVELNFDLFNKKIFLNIFPEESATPQGRPIPEGMLSVA